MRDPETRVLAVCCLLLVLSCSRPGSGPASSPNKGFDSAHWTCTRRVERGRTGRRLPARFAVWLRNDRALISADVAGDRIKVLRLGTEIYSWREGTDKGLKWELPPADERSMIVPSVDYVFRAAPCRDRGKKYNSGTFSQHPFVGYECRDEEDGSKRIVYLASDLGDFPIHVSIAYPDQSLVIYDASDVEVPASFPDALLERPSGVRFEPFAPGASR